MRPFRISVPLTTTGGFNNITALEDMRKDQVLIRGLQCAVRVGVLEEEQLVPRNCEIDFWIEYDLSDAGRTDDLRHTVNYKQVVDLVLDLCRTGRYKLIEFFAYQLFEVIFRNTPAQSVRLRVKKLNPPMEGRFKYVGVDLTRSRQDFVS